jgi:UDP-N-acetylmuramoyl-L-alanyl-D-glutamate--2,6-diaminopimelate ligase
MLGVNMNVLSLFKYLDFDAANDKTLQAMLDTQELLDVKKLTLDSRQSSHEKIFVAVYGEQTRGHDYLEEAAKSGCRLSLIETKDPKQDKQVNVITIDNTFTMHTISLLNLKDRLSEIATLFYFDDESSVTEASDNKVMPSKMPSIAAVTGTNGKTSIASIYAQLNSLMAKKDETSACIGTLGVNLYKEGIPTTLSKTINTTPDILSLYAYLADLKKRNCESVAIEASSHGLAQNRLQGLPISTAIFSNLSQDHLDYHHDMASYATAKRGLLNARRLRNVVLNADDHESKAWLTAASPSLQIFWYSMSPLTANKLGCWAENVQYNTTGVSFTLCANFPHSLQNQYVTCPLIGTFNVANVLAAVTATLVELASVSNDEDLIEKFQAICRCLAKISGVPGRMELFVYPKNQDQNEKPVSTKQISEGNECQSSPSILVDYAHTPDALKQALLSARVHTKGRLTCIFGCGGNRDKSKRAQMGNIAYKYADHIVLTQDNSRNEAPLQIIKDIKDGIPNNASQQSITVELDRKKAIRKAWQQSANQDMILVAGKGHEDYIEINNQRIAYNERAFVAHLLYGNEHADGQTHNNTRTFA